MEENGTWTKKEEGGGRRWRECITHYSWIFHAPNDKAVLVFRVPGGLEVAQPSSSLCVVGES